MRDAAKGGVTRSVTAAAMAAFMLRRLARSPVPGRALESFAPRALHDVAIRLPASSCARIAGRALAAAAALGVSARLSSDDWGCGETWMHARVEPECERAALAELARLFPQLSLAELRRFLKSCNNNLLRAEDKLRRNVAWRAHTFPQRREALLDDLRRGVMVQHGVDRDGRPILYFFGDQYKPGEHGDLSGLLAAMVYTLERAMDSMPHGVEQVCLIIYMPYGASVDLKLIRALSSCFSDNYPERLHRCYVLPAGSWTRYFWKVIRYCFVEAVRDKVVMVRSGERTADIDPAQLPRFVGGDEDWAFRAEEV